MDFESAIYYLDHGFAVKRSNWNKFLKVKYNKLYWALPDNDTLILSNCIMWQDFYLMMTRDSLYKDWQLFDPNGNDNLIINSLNKINKINNKIGVDREQAFSELKNGKCIRMQSWPRGQYIGYSDNELFWCYLEKLDSETMVFKDLVSHRECIQIFNNISEDWSIW